MKPFTNFSLYEFFNSCSQQEIIDAIKDKEIILNIVRLDDVLERIRALVGKPISINSGYRNVTHNRRVGGSTNSQHMKGQAADIECIGSSNSTLAHCIIAEGMVQNALSSDDWFTHGIGQVIVYTDSNYNVRFVHIALANDKHPIFELLHDDGVSKTLIFGIRKIKDFMNLLK